MQQENKKSDYDKAHQAWLDAKAERKKYWREHHEIDVKLWLKVDILKDISGAKYKKWQKAIRKMNKDDCVNKIRGIEIKLSKAVNEPVAEISLRFSDISEKDKTKLDNLQNGFLNILKEAAASYSN